MLILLNGTSSSGKTTVARALQEQYPGVLLLYGVDAMVQTAFPPKCDYPPLDEKAIKAEECIVDGLPALRLRVSPYMYPVYRAAVDFYRTLAQQGYDLIIDELLFDRRRVSHYFEILKDQKVYFVAVKPELAVAVRREKERGDRLPGLAAGLYYDVYDPRFSYDLVIDSGLESAPQAADRIMEMLRNNPQPQGFRISARQWTGA